MKFYILASGSKGNCTIINTNDDKYIMVDCGLSFLDLDRKFKSIGINLCNITHFFFTHSHIDHIRCLSNFDAEKVYSLENTLDLQRYSKLLPYKTYNFENFSIVPVRTFHDAPDSCGYVININDESLVYLTDSGFIPDETIGYIKDKNYYVFESNHDIQMLLKSNRPPFLKQRICGDYGHLSNDQCVDYLNEIIGNDTHEIILAHLSEECNTEEIALKTITNNLVSENKIVIKAAKQYEIIEG